MCGGLDNRFMFQLISGKKGCHGERKLSPLPSFRGWKTIISSSLLQKLLFHKPLQTSCYLSCFFKNGHLTNFVFVIGSLITHTCACFSTVFYHFLQNERSSINLTSFWAQLFCTFTTEWLNEGVRIFFQNSNLTQKRLFFSPFERSNKWNFFSHFQTNILFFYNFLDDPPDQG